MLHMNEEKSPVRAIAKGIWPLLVYLVVYEAAAEVLSLGLQQLLQAGSIQVKNWILSSGGDVSALVTALAMTAGFFAVSQMARRDVDCSLRICCRTEEAWVFALGSAALALAFNVFLTLSGLTAASGAGEQSGTVSLLLGILVYGLLSPAIEETVFRGLVYGQLRRVPALRRSGAMLLSSLLFALYHGNAAQGIYAFCMGVLFCLFLEETGSLPAAALLHGAVNVIVLFLTQSGVYALLCTTVWMICLAGIAVCCGIFLWMKWGRGRRI